ncbi:MAG TPA: AI-2E family transporter [bacterium]|nr:AI-2E family transporter [bacterium]
MSSQTSISYTSIFRVVAVLLALFVAYVIRDVIGLLFVAIVIAAALDPFVDYLQKHKIPRSVSILVIFLITLSLFSLVIVLLIPPISEQVGQLARNLPDYYEKVALGFNRLGSDGSGSSVPATLPDALSSLSSNLAGATGGVFTTLTGIFGGLISLVSLLVIVFYLMVQEDGIKYYVKQIVPEKYKKYSLDLFDRIQNKLGLWLRGQLILCLMVGLAVYIGLTILGVKYALLLGFVAAITEIIPYVGPFIGAIPGVFIAFSDSLTKVLLVVLVYFIVQQLENSVLVPKVMQKSVGLDAVVVVVAILVGGSLGGIVGALLAVPVAVIVEVVAVDFINKKYPQA